MAEKTMRMVPIENIVRLDNLQTRTRVNEEYWKGISKALSEGSEVPPVHVFQDKDGQLLMADGEHRYLAHLDQDRKKISAIIHDSSPETAVSDALLYSIQENGRHGLNWSTEDRKRAVSLTLKDVLMRRWSDKRIAKECGCSPALVARIRENNGQPTERKAPAAKKTTAKKSADKALTKTAAQQANEEIEPDTNTVEAPSAALPARLLPVANANDRRGEILRQFKAWVDQGILEWPDVRRVFMESDPLREPIMFPKFPVVARIIEGSEKKGTLHIVHIGTVPDGDKQVVELATRPHAD